MKKSDDPDHPDHYARVIVGKVPTICATRLQLAHLMRDECLAVKKARNNYENEKSFNLPLPKLVFSLNGESISLNALDKDFHMLLSRADVVHADGMSVVIASRLTKHSLPERIATTDFFHDAALIASESGLGFYFLGGTEKENETAVRQVNQLYPGLRITGRRNGYFSANEEASIIDEIIAANTDVLWLALGRPRQESFAVRYQEQLRGTGWIKTCGGLFKFLAGADKRAPLFMQCLALEWLYRLLHEPKRLFWRYFKTNSVALFMLIFYSRSVSPVKINDDQ